jgi:hypothetical protein
MLANENDHVGDAPLTMAEALGAELEELRPGRGYGDAANAAELAARVAADPLPLSALCISGGGIRSATFALGAIQGLAEQNRLLARFDYLSTVSGGGYIGSWLTAWSNRAGGIDRVIPGLLPGAKPSEPGAADPIGHLRDYNSYLTPRLGAFSADTWTLAAIVFRNLLLNWAVLIPLLMAVLMIPRFFMTGVTFPGLFFGEILYADPKSPHYTAPELDAVSGSAAVRFGLPLASASLFAIALFNTLRYLPGVGGVDHTRADYHTGILLPLIGAVLGYIAFDSLYYLGSTFTEQGEFREQILATLVPCFAAWLAFVCFARYASKSVRVFSPLSMAIFVMAAGTGAASWVTTNFLLWSPDLNAAMSWAEYLTVAPPGILLGFVLGTVLFVGLSSRFLSDEDREWMSSCVAGMLMFCAAWALICGMVLVAPKWAVEWETWMASLAAAVGAAGAWLVAFGEAILARIAPRDPAKPGPIFTASALIVAAAPAVFIVALAIGLAIVTNILLASAHLLPAIGSLPAMDVLSLGGARVPWHDHEEVLERTHPVLLLALFVILLAFGWLMARYVNINTFSLNGMYRDRLIRAYLGASNPRRKANRFTGFARDDDIPMHKLDLRFRPLHVVNVTLNLVKGNRLAWQQRKAQSFSITPLHCGNHELGYRPSSQYGGPDGISLGSAVSISGAAASPNMGSHSSPVAGFIMTMLNARLGSWLGNPGVAGRHKWRQAGPSSAIDSLVKELFGLTSNRNPYVYLSDGSHFENLGLYEMVLRRCRLIVVLDSGCDERFCFDDLGNAVRKIRIDLGISITFEDALMQPLRERRRRCALANIGYSAVDPAAQNGWLIYLKPMLLGTEPPDVLNYAATHPAFPHESTSNQWFNESQTESYRMLGLTTIREICRGWQQGSIGELREHVEKVYLQSRSPAPVLTVEAVTARSWTPAHDS